MRFTQLTALLALGAGAYSMLVVPDVEVNREPSTSALDAETLAIAQLTQTLSIECESCPFVTGKDDKGAKTFSQTPNTLELTLSLDPNARDTISLNNKPLFPTIYTLDPSAPGAAEPYTAVQKSAEDSTKQAEVPIGLDLFIETDEHNVSRLRLHVLSVNGFKTTATMSILEFPVFQTKSGEIFIGEVHVRPPTPAEASAVMCKDNMLCRWKAYLFDTFHKVAGTGSHSHHGKGRKAKGKGKGCGRGGKYRRPPHTVGHEQPPHSEGRPVDANRVVIDVDYALPPSRHAQPGPVVTSADEPADEWHWYYWIAIVVRLVIACLLVGLITMGLGFILTIVLAVLAHVVFGVFYFITGKKRTACGSRWRRCGRREQEIALPADDDDEEAKKGLMSKDEESQLEGVEYSDDLPVYSENTEKQ